MPELRSGLRRSKRLGDIQPAQQTAVQEENLTLPAQNGTRRRGGGGRGRGRGRSNAAAAPKGPSAGVCGRSVAAGRGDAVRSIDFGPAPHCKILPQAVPIGIAEPAFDRIEGAADKDIANDGGSADKVMGVEEEANTTPVPERVSSYLCFTSCSLFLSKHKCKLNFYWDVCPAASWCEISLLCFMSFYYNFMFRALQFTFLP